MGKNVFNYLGIGFNDSRKKFKIKSNLLGYWVYLVAKLLSLILILFYPILSFAGIKIGTKENKRVNILDAFYAADEPKTYWNSALLMGLKVLLFLSGFIIVGVFGGSILLISILITGEFVFYYAIPLIILEVIYIVLFYVYLFPSTYYATKNISVGDSLRYAMNTMKSEGKRKVFFLGLFSLILKLVSIAIPVLVVTVLFQGIEEYAYIFILVFIILLFLIFPYISYTTLVAKVELMHDLGINEEILLKENKKSVEEEKIASMFNEFLKD